MCRWSGAETGFQLIIPETIHPAFGAIHSSPVTSIRTKNPFRRIAVLATLHRFNQTPDLWIDELIKTASEAGRTAIMAVLGELPAPIHAALTGWSQSDEARMWNHMAGVSL
jgi:hypothetical protein